MIENSRKENRFLYGAILTSSGVIGAFTAALIAAIVSINFFPKESWRILFLMGGGVGFITLWLRLATVEELPVLARPEPESHIHWGALLKKYRAPFLCTIGVSALMNVPFYLVIGFINTYFIATGAYAKTTLMFITPCVILLCAILIICFGFLSKHFHPQKMMLVGSLGIMLFAFPFFYLVESGSFVFFIGAELAIIVLAMLFAAPGTTTMTQLFPHAIRYRGVALGDCVGVAFLGGSTPYISVNLIKYTGLSWSPAFYLCLIGFVGFISVIIAMKLLGSTKGPEYGVLMEGDMALAV